MNTQDVVIQLVLKAVDLATKDIDGVHDKLEALQRVLLGNEFERSAEGMQSFGQAVADSTEPLADAAKNTLALSAAMAGVVSYMASNAYTAAKDYESALADLAKVLDGGKEEAKAYGEQLNQLALRYGQNGQQLVAAMANFVQAGYSAKEAFDLVEQSVKLMIAGEIEAGDSSQYLISILKGFKAPASEAANTVDLLNAVSNKYATDVKQLAEGMAAISPIAKNMGFSMSETAGLLTPVIEIYGSGAEAADALKTGLQKLTDTAAPVRAALDSIGVSQLDANGKLRQGKDIMLDVSKAMLGLDDAQKQFVVGQLVGIDQAGRMGEVFNNLATYLGVTDAALNSTGSAMKEIESRLDTAEAKGKRAEESFRQLSVTLGNTFKPQIAGVIAASGDLAAAFDKAVKAGDFAPLLNVIKPQIAAVETLMQAMADNLNGALAGVDWTPLVDGIKAFSGEFGQAVAALTDGMDLSTVEGLRTLLQALINLMGNFSQYVAGVVDGLEPFLDSLNLLFQAVSTNLPAFSNLAGQLTGLATSANQVLPVIAALGGGIFGAVGSVVDLTLKVGLLAGALKLLSAAGLPVGAMLGGLVSRFLALNPAIAGLASALVGLPGLVLGLAAAAGGLGAAIGTVVNKTVEWASGGRSIGTMLYDLVHGSDAAEQAITRMASAEELAAAAANRQAAAQKAKREEEEKATAAADAAAAANERKLALHREEMETMERLQAKYAAMGLVWDKVTGEITHLNEVSAAQRRELLELGTALDKVGADAGVMSGRMTQAGQELLQQLNAIAANSQATSKEINAALLAMIPKLETAAELEALQQKITAFGDSGQLSANQVANAMAEIDRRMSEVGQNPGLESAANRLASVAGASKSYTAALESLADAQSAGLRAEIDLANARGLTGVAQQKSVALAKLEAQWAQAIAVAKQAEIASERASVEAKIAAAQAAGLKTAEDQKEYAALQLKLVALGKEAEAQQLAAAAKQIAANVAGLATAATRENTAATQDSSAAEGEHVKTVDNTGESYKRLIEMLNGARERTKALSDTAGAYFEMQLQGTLNQKGLTGAFQSSGAAAAAFEKAVAGGGGELAKFETEIANAKGAQAALRQEMFFTVNMLDAYETAIGLAEAATKQAFYEQSAQAEQYRLALEKVVTSGEGLSDASFLLQQATRAASGELSLLDQEDLSGLQAAIDETTRKLEDMQQATADAKQRLAEMNAELLEAQGADEKAQLLRQEIDYNEQLAEIRRQMQEAELSGNREQVALLQQQLAVLDSINQKKIENIRRDEEARKKQASTPDNANAGPSSGGGGTAAPPTKTYQLNLVGSGGRTLTANTNADPSSFLDDIATAQRRSAL